MDTNVCEEAPLVEPRIVASTFIDGIAVSITNDFMVHFVGWVHVAAIEYDGDPERRIVARAVMTPDVARQMVRDLRKALERGGN